MKKLMSVALCWAWVVGCSGAANRESTSDDKQETDPSGADDTGGTDTTESECPSSFEACGGDIVGTWKIIAFCPRDGGSLTNPCEHPYSDRAACRGADNQGICTLLYQGEIRLDPSGSAEVVTSLGANAAFTFDDDCLAAIARAGGDDACRSMNNGRLACSFADGLCTCSGRTQPEEETIHADYVLSGSELTIGPDLGEPIGGPYCVEGDRMVIRGPIGWAYWVLERVDHASNS